LQEPANWARPRDETEALLACQMAAIHNAIMVAARRLNHVENIPQQDSASNMFNKLARTFAMQMDTLERYRATGTQTIQVQHVTVNEGGQAIVGPVTQHRGGASDESSRQPHAPEPTRCVEAAGSAPLLSHIEAVAAPMPGAGGQGWKVCRCHGGRGGAPKGPRNGRYRHGAGSRDVNTWHRDMTELVRTAKSMMAVVCGSGSKTIR
jgi:hypothetical protein